jgi:hypothetical protein
VVSTQTNSVRFPESEPYRHLLSQLVTKHVQALMPLNDDKKVFLGGNIPGEKLNSAIAAYAPDVSVADVLLLIDSTVFGSATNGLLLTATELYAHNLGRPANMAKLTDITSAVFDNGFLIQWLDINGINFYQNTRNVKRSTVKALADWLNHYASDLRDASDPEKRHLLLGKKA